MFFPPFGTIHVHPSPAYPHYLMYTSIFVSPFYSICLYHIQIRLGWHVLLTYHGTGHKKTISVEKNDYPSGSMENKFYINNISYWLCSPHPLIHLMHIPVPVSPPPHLHLYLHLTFYSICLDYTQIRITIFCLYARHKKISKKPIYFP